MTKRYSTSRQKACRHCADAKARCDRRPGCCGRCRQRELACTYIPSRTSELTEGVNVNVNVNDSTIRASSGPYTPTSNCENDRSNALPGLHGPRLSSTGPQSRQFYTTPVDSPQLTSQEQTWPGTERDDSEHYDGDLSFSSLELICPIEADDIRNRWLNSYVPLPGQSIKTYPVNVSAFIFRALKSYAAVSIRGHGIPPFIHPSHLNPGVRDQPLATCLNLVRVCHQPLPGSESATAGIIRREMAHIYEHISSYDEFGILLAFQAYLIYSMVLFFQLNHGTDPFLRQAMMNLQELASSCARKGLVCVSEQSRTRPRWEAWTVAEAKRRTLYTMFLFDSILATQDGLPTYLGTELQGLQAPAGRALWRAETRKAWRAEYNTYLAQWPDRFLQIEDLWPIPPDMDLADVTRRRERLDHWLEDADEFCFMLFAVTGCTHGC